MAHCPVSSWTIITVYCTTIMFVWSFPLYKYIVCHVISGYYPLLLTEHAGLCVCMIRLYYQKIGCIDPSAMPTELVFLGIYIYLLDSSNVIDS